MSWLLYALAANIFFSLTNLFDKFFNSKKIKSVYTFAFLLNIVYAIFVIITSVYLKNTFRLNTSAAYASVAGLFWFFMWLFFWKAMQTGEASRVSAIFFTQPLFSSVIGIFFFGESLNSVKWSGIFLIVAGAFLTSWEKKTKDKIFNRAYGYAMAAAVLSAVGNAVSKYAMKDMPALTVNSIAFYFTLPLYFMLLLNGKVLKEVRENIINKKTMLQFFFRGLIGYGGIVFFMLSLGSGPISLVSAISGTQPLFVLVFTVGASFLLPKLIHEEVSIRAVLGKSLAIAMIVAGALLIGV